MLALHMTHTKRLFFLFTLCILAISQSIAQIEVEPALAAPRTPENLIKEVFAGKGVDITKITFSGNKESIGYFNNGTSDVGLTEGFMMTTGRALLAATPNDADGDGEPNQSTAQDATISELANGEDIHDLAIYEIEFIPKRDTIEFRYAFASEEYPEFGCNCFNDVFGFFLKGPGYPDWTNLAVVPGTLNEPVSVKSIHPLDPVDNVSGACPGGTILPDCDAVNEHLYIDNLGSTTLTYDGLTKVLSAKTVVEPCQTYTIKLAIADVADPLYDSAIFFEANSFGTDELDVKVELESIDGTLIEGCAGGNITFSFDKPVPRNYRINIAGSVVRDNPNIDGDYTLEPVTDIIKRGEKSLTLNIRPLSDAVEEGLDSLGFTVDINDCESETYWFYFRENDLEELDLGEDQSVCPGDSIQLEGLTNVSVPQERSFTSALGSLDINTLDNNGTGPDDMPTQSIITVDNIQPADIRDGLIKEVCVNIGHINIEDIDLILESPSGQLLELSTDNGGNARDYSGTCFSPDAMTPITAGTAPFTGKFQPEGDWAVLNGGDSNGDWILYVKDDKKNDEGLIHNWSITFNPLYQLFYQWSPTTGLSCTDCPNPKAAPAVETAYELAITDSYGCIIRDSVIIKTNNDTLDIPVSCIEETQNSITFGWDPMTDIDYEVNVDGQGWIRPSGSGAHTVSGLGEGAVVEIAVRGSGPCSNVKGTTECFTSVCFPPDASINRVIDLSCWNTEDGRIDLNADDPNIVFIIDQDTSFTKRFSGLAAGDYEITALDTFTTCFIQLMATIAAPDTLKLDTFKTLASCGENNALAAISINGGTPPYSILWDVGAGTDTIKNIGPGTYTVQVTDDFDCVATQTITIESDDTPTTASIAISCEEATSNSLSYSWEPVAGIQLYEVQVGDEPWSMPSAATSIRVPNLNILESVQIRVRGSSDCIVALDSMTCMTTDCIIPSGTFDVVRRGQCADYDNGVLSIASNDPNLLYILGTDTSSIGEFGDLGPGDYIVELLDTITLCSSQIDTVLTNLDSLKITVFSQAASCGLEDGIAAVTVTGGEGPYQILWDNGETTDTIKNLSSGTYSVEVTDNFDCVVTQTLMIDLDDTPTNASIVISCEETTSNSISYSWVPVPGIDLYEVQVGDEPWSMPSADTSIQVTNLGILESVQIRVRGSNDCVIALDSMTCMTANCTLPTGEFDIVRSGQCTDYDNGVLSIFSSDPNLVYILGTDTSALGVFEDLVPGDYTVELLDTLSLCNSLLDTVLSNLPPLEVAIYSQAENCGLQDGIAAVTVSGGEGPYQVIWDGGETSDTIRGLLAETYTATIIDARGCTINQDVLVDLTIDNLTDLRVDVSCPRITNNSIDISWEPIPTITDFEIKINDGDWITPSGTDLTHQLKNLGFSEVFDIKVRGNSDCGGAVIGNEICATSYCVPVVGQDLIQKDVSCHGQDDGVLDITINTFEFTTTTTLPFVIRDSAGFNVIDYTQDSTILLTAATSGYVVVAEDTIRATEEAPMVTFDNLAPGDYTITYWDTDFTCNSTRDITILEPDSLGIVTNFEGPVSCPGSNDGTIVLFALGGSGPYTYDWNDGEFDTEVSTNLAPGTYDLVVTDASGCTANQSYIIEEPSALIDTTYKQNIGCGEVNTGQAAIVSSLAMNYQVNWDNGATGDSLFNLSPGTYKGYISTDNGCIDSVEIDLTAVDFFIETSNDTPACGNVNGENALITANAYVTALGNPDANFQYEWNDPNNQITDTAFALTPGDYIVTVTDLNSGCVKEEEVFITAPDPITVNNILEEETCIGLGDGSVIFDIRGGVPGYNYDWGDDFFRTDPGRNDLTAGNYVVTITDDNGCTLETAFTIEAPDSIQLSFTTEPVSCVNPTGSATVIATGGSGDFDYRWNDPDQQTSDIATGLTAAEFEVNIIDRTTGCTAVGRVMITEEEPLEINVTSTPSFCAENASGTATVEVVSGSGNYTYLWDDETAQETATAENLAPGEYMILVIDEMGCEESKSITVENQATTTDISFTTQDISCEGDANGSIEVEVVGDAAEYNYRWSTESIAKSLDNLEGGTYILTITDENGCATIDSVTIVEPTLLTGNFQEAPISCHGERDGQIDIAMEGGTAPFQYSIDGSAFSGSSNFADLRPNIYEVVVKDANGCEVDLGTVSLQEPEEINVVIDRQLITDAGRPITIDSKVENGQGLISYEWISDSEQASIICADCESPLVQPSFGQNYEVVVTDEMGCTATSSIKLLVKQSRGIYVPTGFSPNDDGYNDVLTVHGQEGTTILSFKLFDRWGELVYQSNNFPVNELNMGWDGIYRGQKMNAAVFTWVAEVLYPDNVTETVKGHTTLIK